MWSNFCFAYLVGISIEITSSAGEIKVFPIPAGIKNYKWIIQKKKKKHDKIVRLIKTKLNSIKVFISEALIDLCISHDEFFSVNMSREYDDMEEKIKNPSNRYLCLI